MAKYAEAYIHYAREGGSELELETLVRQVLTIGEHATAEFLRYLPDADVVARVEESSRKVWTTIIAATAVISQYGSIRSGADQLLQDGRKAAEFVIEKVLTVEQVSKEELIRTERRRGLPGKLRALFKQVEAGGISAEEATEKALHVIEREGAHRDELGYLRSRLHHEFQEQAHVAVGVPMIATPGRTLPVSPTTPPQPNRVPHPIRGTGIIGYRDRNAIRLSFGNTNGVYFRGRATARGQTLQSKQRLVQGGRASLFCDAETPFKAWVLSAVRSSNNTYRTYRADSISH